MPGRFERHGRSPDGRGSQPPRSAERAQAAAEPQKRPPGRKDTRRWCKGKTGTGHVPVLVQREPLFRREPAGCKWAPGWRYDGIRWSCCHQEICERCHKVLRDWLPAETCPDWPGDDEQRARAGDELREILGRIAERRGERRPVITGPQGYRKQKAGKTL